MEQQNGQPLGQGPSEVAEEEIVTIDSMETLKQQYGLVALRENLDLPKVKWIVKGVLEERSPATILGNPKVGKSWMALSLGIAIVTGSTFLGRDAHMAGPVIYFSGEGHISKTNERVAALLKGQGMTLDDLGGNLIVSTRRIHIGDSNVQADILAIVKEIKPVLVVFDPLARFLKDEDENSSKDMRPITDWMQFDLCRHTAVLVPHHTTKDGNTARGTGDLFGFVATQMKLKGTPGKGFFKVETILRNAESPEDYSVKLNIRSVEQDGEPTPDVAELVVQEVGPKKPEDPEEVRRVQDIFRRHPMGLSIAALRKESGFGWTKAKRLAIAAEAELDGNKWVVRAERERWQGSFRLSFPEVA
jgi:hypothetical protein